MKTMRSIIACMMLVSSLSYGMDKSLQDLKTDLETEEKKLKKDQSFSQYDLTKGTIARRKENIERLKKAIALKESGLTATGQKIVQKGEEKFRQVMHPGIKKLEIQGIQSIDKLVATNNQLFLITNTQKETSKATVYEIRQDGSTVFEPSVEELKMAKEKIKSSITDEYITTFAAHKNNYIYGYFIKKEDKTYKIAKVFSDDPEVLFGESEAVIFTNIDNKKEALKYMHHSPIKSLFFDDTFIVSHSNAGTIKFIGINDLDKSEIQKKAEYTAEILLDYKNKSMVVEEYSPIFGTVLLIKYFDDNANVIGQPLRVAGYKKKSIDGKKINESRFLAAINDQGDVATYDKNDRSLIHFIKKDNLLYDAAQFKEGSRFFSTLGNRVGQQIHFINDTALLVYDDQIYTVTLPNVQSSKEKFNTKAIEPKLLFHLEQPLITPEIKNKGLRTIITTAIQNNKTLWIISKEGKDYFIRSINIEKAN